MPFGEKVCQPVGVFCSIDAVLNQIQRFDEISRTENIAQRPVAPWHTSIRVGVICRAGPLVMPAKPTARLVAAGAGRELPQRTSASSSKTKAKTVTVNLCRLAMTPNEKSSVPRHARRMDCNPVKGRGPTGLYAHGAQAGLERLLSSSRLVDWLI